GTLKVISPTFFVKPGVPVQLQVLQTGAGGVVTDVTSGASGTQYDLPVAKDVATVSADGLVPVTVSPLPIRIVPSLFEVLVEHQGEYGLCQLAILDDDSDGDLLVDSFEAANGLDPFSKSPYSADKDGDGLSNLHEALLGTDLSNPDTDGDGVPDKL